jgi:HAD superfamily hydrolase (TIGR01509 family)
MEARLPRALIFDLDGTLIALARAPGRLRRVFVATETPVNYAMAALERLALSEPLRFALDGLRRWRGVGTREELSAIEGATDLLHELSARFRLGVVTNRGRPEARAFVSRHGLEGCLGCIVTRADVWRLKPHPAAIERAARELEVDPCDAWMIGDMPVDMRAACRAGSHAVGVQSGFCTEAELRRSGAQRVLESVLDLRRELAC